MAPSTVTLSKFIGSISLGLLTGVSYTLTTTTLPPLLALPTAQPAHHTFAHLQALTSRHQFLLSTLSTSTLLLAYVLSPSKQRHPFLLWAVLAVGVGYSREAVRGVIDRVLGEGGDKGVGKGNGGYGSESGDEEWEVENGKSATEGSGMGGGLNGEVVREGMERWRVVQMGRTVCFGVGWVVTVVGLWGDRFVGFAA